MGLSREIATLPGVEVCRVNLLRSMRIFGNPTSSMYRADLVRRTNAFFPHARPHVDTSACYALLRDCDYGFVHEALSIKRRHNGQLSSKLVRNAQLVAELDHLLSYGPIYLTESEFDLCLNQRLEEYYRLMGGCVWRLMGFRFWEFHRSRMQELGYPLSGSRLAWSACLAMGRAAANPGRVASGISQVLTRLRSLF
jgi:hypothetical protein